MNFPPGAAGQMIDERICEIESSLESFPSATSGKPAVRQLVFQKGAVDDLEDLLKCIANFPKNQDGMWDLPDLFATMKKEYVERFGQCNIDVYLCHVVEQIP